MKSLSDIVAPATVKRKLLEKDVQKQCVDWARARGYWARKFSSMTSTAEPDYLFARMVTTAYDRYTAVESVQHKLKFATEFKRPGGVATEAQEEEHGNMRLAGWFVFVCDSFEGFKKTVIAYEKECTQ